MKTYPLIHVLIKMYWLLLFIVLGILVTTLLKPILFKPTVLVEEITIDKAKVTPLNPLVKTGKNLFRTNCATCHNKDMKRDMTGPALAGVRGRWAVYPEADLYDWIRNSSKLIKEGHPRALAIFNEWRKSPMTPFNSLKDEDIEAILAYIDSVE